MASRVGTKLAQRLTTNLPMVTTQRLATEVSLPIKKETGGLEELRIDPPRSHRREKCRETNP